MKIIYLITGAVYMFAMIHAWYTYTRHCDNRVIKNFFLSLFWPITTIILVRDKIKELKIEELKNENIFL